MEKINIFILEYKVMFKTVTILKELEISSCDEIGKSHFFSPHFTMIVTFRHMSKERVFLSC